MVQVDEAVMLLPLSIKKVSEYHLNLLVFDAIVNWIFFIFTSSNSVLVCISATNLCAYVSFRSSQF